MTAPDPTTEFAVREHEAAVALVVDLIARMEKADEGLRAMIDVEPNRADHLNSKADGVRLCLSYAREALSL